MDHLVQRLLACTLAFTAINLLSPTYAAEINSTHKYTGSNDELAEQVIEEVLVVGRRPGPPLWRVTHGENTLWIFATLSPLPKDLVWDNASVKHIISEASHFIAPPGISASTSNPFKGMRVLRRIKEIKRLPGRKRLADVVPPDLLKRFESMGAFYNLPMRRVERLRPLPAVETLLERAYDQNRLQDDDRLPAQMRKMAKRGKLTILESVTEISLDEILEVFDSVPLAAELECFESALQSMTQNQQAAIERANAWAGGSAEGLLKLDYPEPDQVCADAIESNDIAREARKRSNAQWLHHAQDALTTERVTLSSLPMAQIAHSDGLLARLSEAGYQVHGQRARR